MNTSTVPIRYVSHTFMAVDRVADVEHLMSLFSDTFQLPVETLAEDYGPFFSGLVYAGNVALEFVASPHQVPTTWSGGIASEPGPLSAVLDELDARGITHGDPQPYTRADSDGRTQIYWTTVGLPELATPGTGVFLCEYQPAVYQITCTPHAEDKDQQRELLRQELDRRHGGPLGVQYVKEIVVGATDLAGTRRQWQKLLDPREMSDEGAWQVGDGPAIRVVPAPENGIRAWLIKVRSLDRARTFLAERDLLERDLEGRITLKVERPRGFDIQLVE